MSSVGQALGGAVGAVVGFFTPLGPLYGAQIGMMIGGYLDPPKGPTNYGPRLDDLTVQTSTYGAVIPRCYGMIAVNGNVFWLENNRLKEVKKKEKSGGKGGGGGSTTVTYSYYATFAVGLCQGPIAGVRRVWIGSKLVYDMSSTNADTISASQSFASKYMEVHTGAADQPASARMQATLGTANTPAYRGLAYIVFRDYPLKDHGNSLLGAQVKVEVFSVGTSEPTLSYLSQTDYAQADAMVYNPELNEIWATNDSVDGLARADLIRIDAATAEVIGIITTSDYSGAPYAPLVYDSAGAAVWGYHGTKLFKYHSNGEFAFGVANSGIQGLRVSPVDGSLWVKTSTAFQRINKTTGAVDLTINAGTVIYDFVFSGDSIWFTSNSSAPANSKIYRAVIATQVVSTVHTAATVLTLISADTTRNKLWVCQNSATVLGFDIATLTASVTLTLPMSPGAASLSLMYDAYRDVIWTARSWGGAMGVAAISASSGVTFASFVDGNSALDIYVAESAVYVLRYKDWLYTASKITFGVTPGTVRLGEIVQTEALQVSGLSASDIDVSALTQIVRGYKVSSIAAIRSAIEPLQGVWPFDVIQAGYQIECKPRGSASAKTVSADDLGAVAVGSTAASLTVSREMDSQIPGRVSLRYLDPSREYDTGEQYAERLSVERDNTKQLDIAVVLSGSEAAQAAERLLYIYWMERYGVSLTLPPTHGDLEPSDVVTVLAADGSYLLRLKQIDYQADGVISCRATFAGQAIYTPAAVGEEPVTTNVSELLPTPETTYALLDIPCMVDAQNTPGFALAATAAGNWPGAVLYRSSDAGSTWGEVVTQYPPGAVIGTLQGNSVAAHDGRMIDTATVLDVALVTGELASVTQTAMLNGANHFAFGADGRWEIIAAQNCVLQVDGTYRLTDLMRGRFGTEWASGLHASDDTLVLLDAGDLTFSVESSGLIGLSRDYRAISDGLAMDSQASTAFAYLGVNLKPLSPVYLNGNRHPSTNDWSLDWIRRTRIGGDWRDGVDAAIGEATEAYTIEIYADGTYASVKRTINTASAAATYSSANQVADFGSNQSTLYVKVYQVSATVGKGYPLTTSITR